MFYSYQKLGEEVSGSRTTVYLWLEAQEYYPKEAKLLKGNGASLPIALIFKDHNLIAVLIACQ